MRNNAAGRARHPSFITFEGVDGAGKSTHVAWFAETLGQSSGREVVLTREPGGTPLGESLRELVLHTPMALDTEALVMFAARRQHIADVIAPALARGAWVVCDRFTDASYAYQGAGRGLDRQRLDALRDWVHPNLMPGRTLLFDLDPEVAKRRVGAAREQDRFEREAADFFGRVRGEYLRLATDDWERFLVLDGSRTIAELRIELEKEIASLCSRTISQDV